MQHRLAGEVAVDQAFGDGANLVPASLDGDFRLWAAGGDLAGEEGETDTGPLEQYGGSVIGNLLP